MRKRIRVTFIGDIMCKASMLPAYRTCEGGYDFTALFERMRPYFDASDYVIANLETPISPYDADLTTEPYSFCLPRELAEACRCCGIDFVATANNHCLDRGIKGLSTTVDSLDAVGLAHTGVFADPARRAPLVVEVEGFKIGFLSYTYGTNAFSNRCYLPKGELWRVNLFQEQELDNPLLRFAYGHARGILYRAYCKLLAPFSENARRAIYERREPKAARRRDLQLDIEKTQEAKPDLIVMCMHAGGQYNPEATPDTKELASWLLDQGVDVVAGSHEHVVHGGDFGRSDGKVAAYCLGNFDGVAGVYVEPFDKMAEYSIAWNLYLDLEESGSSAIKSLSFSILKSICLDGTDSGVQVVPLAELYRDEADDQVKRSLLNDARIIARHFCGKDAVGDSIKCEYAIERQGTRVLGV